MLSLECGAVGDSDQARWCRHSVSGNRVAQFDILQRAGGGAVLTGRAVHARPRACKNRCSRSR